MIHQVIIIIITERKKNELTEEIARSLFSSAVTGLSQDDINSLIDYWESFCKEQQKKEGYN